MSDDDGEQSEGRRGLGSPRVSGSGQVDAETAGDRETQETQQGDIKAETKPLVRESAANTVKTGESGTEWSRVTCHSPGVTGTWP